MAWFLTGSSAFASQDGAERTSSTKIDDLLHVDVNDPVVKFRRPSDYSISGKIAVGHAEAEPAS